MHFFAVSLSLLFAASTLAYEIVEPSGTKGWTNFGSNTYVAPVFYVRTSTISLISPCSISWKRVNTDPMTITLILTNEASTFSKARPPFLNAMHLSESHCLASGPDSHRFYEWNALDGANLPSYWWMAHGPNLPYQLCQGSSESAYYSRSDLGVRYYQQR